MPLSFQSCSIEEVSLGVQEAAPEVVILCLALPANVFAAEIPPLVDAVHFIARADPRDPGGLAVQQASDSNVFATLLSCVPA
eukprot:3143542-Amphidinium_carterae.1